MRLLNIADNFEDFYPEALVSTQLELLSDEGYSEFELFDIEDDEFVKLITNLDDDFMDAFDDAILIP